jgi:polygalacturonase
MPPSITRIALIVAIVCCSLAAVARADLSIDAFGALHSDPSLMAAHVNGKALYNALAAANASGATDRTVVVPAGQVYTYVPMSDIWYLNNVRLRLDGTLSLYTAETSSAWPNGTDGTTPLNALCFRFCNNLELFGNGVIEGNGHGWWAEVIFTGQDHRPRMLNTISGINTTLTGWTMRNSPSFHALLDDMINLTVTGVTVHVDVTAQTELLTKAGLWSDGTRGFPPGVPMFPLNTDGIDVAGRDIVVRNVSVQNFDDSVCIKPLNQQSALVPCTENVLVEDVRITYGVGASVGSVPPKTSVNCIRNVTFRNIVFDKPIKGIYVKPNPGTHGTGIIDQITYENIVGRDALWWAIWVSTQQQKQPGHGADTGCSFFYPLLNTTCPLQPLVPVTRLTLRNVTMTGGLLSPGVLRCDEAGPCTGWVFDNVKFTSKTDFPFGAHFLCHGLVNASFTNTEPACKPNDEAAANAFL